MSRGRFGAVHQAHTTHAGLYKPEANTVSTTIVLPAVTGAPIG